MEPLWIGLGLIAIVLGTRVVARRMAVREPRFLWVLAVPTLVGFAVVLWAALRVFPAQPVLAIGLGVIVLPTAVLFLRRMLRRTSGRDDFEPSGSLSSASFDYLVWSALAVPFLFAGLLLVLLITGGFKPN